MLSESQRIADITQSATKDVLYLHKTHIYLLLNNL